MKETRKRIGDELKAIRQEKGVAKLTIEQATGMSHHTIDNIESGKNDYRLDKLLAYMEHLNIDFPEITIK